MKPILACDYETDKAKFPYMGLPKIDGVRALNIDNRLVGRSGKQFKNKLNTEFFSDPRFNGFDGEMVVDRITGYGICNETTSALGTIKGVIPTRWCLFDLVVDGFNNHESYYVRWRQLCDKVNQLHEMDPSLRDRLWVIPYVVLNTQEEVDAYELQCLDEQYEGIILRDFNGTYKYGRCTAKESNYLRLKRFIDSEIVVTHVIEGQSNQNELEYNPHGYAERSTNAENMVPNGMVGTICGRALKEEKLGDLVVLHKDQEIEVSPGKMTHEERRYYFEHQDEIIGKIGKFQFFPVGVKDKPRFPTWQGFRDPVDL
jgi:DNA ligase-1